MSHVLEKLGNEVRNMQDSIDLRKLEMPNVASMEYVARNILNN